MASRRYQYFYSEMVTNLVRHTIAQQIQILTMALAETVEIQSNWSYHNSYNGLNSSAFHSTGSSPRRLSRGQRNKRNKQLKRLQQKEMPVSAAKPASKSRGNPAAKKVTPVKRPVTATKANVSKPATTTSNVTTKNAKSLKPISAASPIKNVAKLSKENLSLEKVPGLSDMLYELATEFQDEIQKLQKVYDKGTNGDSEKPIVAEITLKDGCSITPEVIKLIRSLILEAIDNLQKSESPDTPVFYCLTNNKKSINILCRDEYAFKFLENCFIRTLTVFVRPLKASADRLYCFSAIYTGIIKDVKEFLLQIRLHVPKMHTEHWIVASSKEVQDAERNETQFLFLVDELSALMLEHQYANRFFINLNEVVFHNHGQLPKWVEVYLID